jgi:hypothetical protein
MPTDWADKVRAAITHLETKTGRVLEPDQALALIDDVVEGKFAAGDLATIHGIPQESIRTTLGQITRAVGSGRVRSLATAVVGVDGPTASRAKVELSNSNQGPPA